MEPDKILIEVKNQLEEIDNQRDALIAQNRLLRQEQIILTEKYDKEIRMNIKSMEYLGDKRTEILNEFMDICNKYSLYQISCE
jgi:archaellum component FlaC